MHPFLKILLIVGLSAAAADPPAASWGSVLDSVLREGRVDYRELKERPARLEKFVNELGAVSADEYGSWSKPDQLAFWLNAYNAFTVKAIVDHYPIQARGLAAWRYPRNSIRQIPGVWDRLKWKAAGRELTLDEIEHKIVRPGFREPRAHMALVCAARGCPPLRPEPYVGRTIERQLDEQARIFLASPHGLRLDRERNELLISSIFKWFPEDFGGEKGALEFVARHAPPDVRDYLRAGDFKLRYLYYDWTLNDRERP